MSVEIHQYLDNSGGSNFTEHAPRPPVGPGEENELHSTGGHSNKSSSGSHKSLTSNRSNGSGAGAATPRRSQKPAKLSPTSGAAAAAITIVSASTTQDNGEHEAPLGFEPEGSVDEKANFNENNTPPYTKWAEKLDYLLEDADGVALFKKYLTQESGVNLFEFYFAWKYLQDLNAEDVKGIASLVKTMYKVFIKGDKGDKKLKPVPKETKDAIASLVSARRYPKTIFDSAKDHVVDVLEREFYSPFIKSNIYLQYIQSMEESPKEDSVNSSGSVSARPMSTVLPTVPEHSELDLCHVSSTTDNMTSDGPVLTLTVKNMKMTERLRQESKIKPEDQAGYYLQKEATGGFPPHPYHTCNTYLPISAIDSERQSLSSEALTDDTHSITDSSVDGYPQYTNRISVRRYYKKIKNSAQRNPEIHSSVSNHIIPPKNRLSKVSNVAETNPMEFAQLLTDKLQQYLEETNHREMIRCKLSAMSEDEGTTDDSHSILSSTTGGAGTTNTTLNQLLNAIQAGDHDAEAQDILDMHCKRIWERSGQHTPAKSPSRAKSPDHLQQHTTQTKRIHTLPRQPAVSVHPSLPLSYSKQSAIIPASKPLPASSSAAILQQYPMDNSYPLAASSNSQVYNKSNSRHGMATFSSRAEQQSIFKPPPGVSTNNQKVAEWISRNEEILQHSSIHGPPESDKSSFKRSSQRSGSTSASPRAIRSNRTHGKGAALSADSKRIPQDDKHSFKSKSTGSSSKDRRSMSRSAGEPTALLNSSGGQQQQTLSQRKGIPVPPQIKVAFFLLDEPIPYSVTVPGVEITLAKFKELITKKGNYRYFFKKATDDEFGRDVPFVLEEITNDNQVLPKWDAKVVGHVKKVE